MRNRFKGLDLIDRVPDELWTEVLDIVQETGIKTILKKKINVLRYLPWINVKKSSPWATGRAVE